MNIFPQWYILNGHEPVPTDDIREWGEFMEKVDRHVRKTHIGDAMISTVFLAILHPGGYLFESLVFGGVHDGYMDRYYTWDEAEQGHDRIIDMLVDSLADEQNTDKVVEALLDLFNPPKL